MAHQPLYQTQTLVVQRKQTSRRSYVWVMLAAVVVLTLAVLGLGYGLNSISATSQNSTSPVVSPATNDRQDDHQQIVNGLTGQKSPVAAAAPRQQPAIVPVVTPQPLVSLPSDSSKVAPSPSPAGSKPQLVKELLK